MKQIRVVDSHTGGEPTRLVLDHPLPGVTMREKCDRLTREIDHLRSGIVCEPRGSDILVGAWLTEPEHAESVAGVVFFNNVGTLGMCGHGLIGVARTLQHLGRIQPGEHRIDTPVGTIPFILSPDGSVSFENVVSYRLHTAVAIEVPKLDRIVGDVAYGGNWFFLCESQIPIVEANRGELMSLSLAIKSAVLEVGIVGADGAEIDHIELTQTFDAPEKGGRNFVLCPGNAYDRSPCGTGTSAKVACLAADGKLAEGETWRQVSVTESEFTATYRSVSNGVIPRITGLAHVVAESTLLFDSSDPLLAGRLG